MSGNQRSYRAFHAFAREADGATSIIFALCAVMLFGLAALAIDHGHWMNRKSFMQSTADAAALAGAWQLAVRAESADAIAASQAFLTSKKVQPGTYQITADKTTGIVSIALSENGKIFAGGIIGVKSAQIGIISEAIATPSARPCIIALDPASAVGIDFSLAGSVTAIDCAIWSNSKSSTSFDLNGSGTGSSSQNCAVGGVSGSAFSITPPVQSNCQPAIDPLASWDPPVPAACDNSLPDRLNSGAVTLSPGVYCGGLKVAGTSQVTLQPGIYTMKDGPLSVTSAASITGTGVTILLTGTGAAINFLGSSSAHLSAATSGPTEGLVIAAGRGEPVTASMVSGGAEMDIEGTVYLPTHNLSYGGNSESLLPASYSLLIAKTIKFYGGSQVVVRGDPSTSKVPAKTAVAPGSIRLVR